MALPPSDPAVKLIVACPSPAVADNEVGADGVVDGVTITELEAALSPTVLTAFK